VTSTTGPPREAVTLGVVLEPVRRSVRTAYSARRFQVGASRAARRTRRRQNGM
jgi:hypothetical protein